jgi:prepilin-type N-terminal cleavage/methylation domain-containing protein
MMMRRERGFTLVELMTVVTIVGLVMALAAMAVRPNRGEQARSFARSLLGVCHEARQTAISQRQTSRIRLALKGPEVWMVTVQTRDPNNAANWLPLGGTIQLPFDVQICAPDATANLGTATPACPIAGAKDICIAPSGAVTVLDAPGACDDTAAGTGATLYVRTADGKNRYKLVIFGLTALPRIMDTW